MSIHLHHQPSRRFNTKIADIYDRARPTYPKQMMNDELLLLMPEAGKVLDVGCGTGLSTRLFLGEKFQVVGVDSSLQMLRAAQAKRSENMFFVGGLAERMPFRDRSFSLITIAQAFHWFDTATAIKEFYRLLGEGGVVALFWNTRKNENKLNSSFEELCHQYFPEFPAVIEREQECVSDWLWEENGFQKTRFHTFPNEQHLDYPAFHLRCMSISFIHHGLDDTSRQNFEDDLKRLFDRFEQEGRVTIEYDCKLHLYQRMASAVE